MKTYEEYYRISKKHCEDSLVKSEAMYGKDWWRNHTSLMGETNQDYDFIKPLSDKNDAPIVKNLTNVYNSEWCILHNMLSEMVTDYIKDNQISDDVYSYSININLDKPNKRWTIYLKKSDNEQIVLPESEPFDFPTFDLIADEDVIRKFDSLNGTIYKYVRKFLNNNSNDIPKVTNNVNFLIDNLKHHDSYTSDSSLSVGWDRNGDENADELLVVSM